MFTFAPAPFLSFLSCLQEASEQKKNRGFLLLLVTTQYESVDH